MLQRRRFNRRDQAGYKCGPADRRHDGRHFARAMVRFIGIVGMSDE